ncbi:MAG: Fic family protein [Prevotella pectinovora]|jgi:Fic family protein|uniref:Fic family protein n=1 Tax=Prevotella TaxID=838 RepID=UPI0003359278|nr:MULTISPECIES: Fic family protein [Prevotella]MDY4779391.1 Fic family protein [Prevotella pectinovora]CDD05759.1 filamentation induced by cAMP protein Fic [Prevotella sp. CAG:592]
MASYKIPLLPLPYDLETKTVLRQANKANRKLAELKGVAQAIPNERILISSLTLQEAKDSSAVENIVTTQDDLYRAGLDANFTLIGAATKEVLFYREAINEGFKLVRNKNILALNDIKRIQEVLEQNSAGFRTTPGTQLKRSSDGAVIYTPPQDGQRIVELMSNLEQFINDDELCPIDPLVKMAIIHHQFESIHPFYDGNGRTGRIVNILYLVTSGLLDLPILYLSRYITHNKAEYYERIQAIRNATGDNSAQWEAWILYMLRGVEQTAEETIALVKNIGKLMTEYKNIIRPAFGGKYSHELLNGLFYHPYTKIGHLESNMQVSRQTAAKYLDRLASLGLLQKERMGKENYYINTKLMELFLTFSEQQEADNTDGVESVHVEKSPNP